MIDMQNKLAKVNKKLISTLNSLKFFALNKEGTVEGLATFIKKDYTTALRTIRKLLNTDAIKLERLERTSARGKERRIYRIMLHGLFSFMEIDKETANKNFDEMAKAHKDKLLVFRKWEYFKKKDLAGLIRERFFEGLKLWARMRLRLLFLFSDKQGEPNFPKMHSDQNTANATDIHVLGIVLMLDPLEHVKQVVGEPKWTELVKLFKALEEDYELRMFKGEVLSHFEREHEETLKALSQWKDFSKNL